MLHIPKKISHSFGVAINILKWASKIKNRIFKHLKTYIGKSTKQGMNQRMNLKKKIISLLTKILE